LIFRSAHGSRQSFSGFKQSGIGRELGEKGLDSYTEVKTITVSLA